MADRRANHEGSKAVKRADGRYQCRVVIAGKTRFFTGGTASIAREKDEGLASFTRGCGPQ